MTSIANSCAGSTGANGFHNCSEVEERDDELAEKLVEAGMLADEVNAFEADGGDCRYSDDEYYGL